MMFDEDALHELAASIREHGVLQPILVRPLGDNRYQLVAGERRWRASKEAGLATIPALVEELDDDTALEISIIENLQREDLSPLEEATMYDRMVREHGYSIRKLAEKLGKDKGYLENRLRLADAPRGDPRAGVCAQRHPVPRLRAAEGRRPEEAPPAGRPGRPRRAVAGQASREDRRPPARRRPIEELEDESRSCRSRRPQRPRSRRPRRRRARAGWTGQRQERASSSLSDDSLVQARHAARRRRRGARRGPPRPDVVRSIPEIDRANLAKYLTIAKLKLENAIAMVRSGDSATRRSAASPNTKKPAPRCRLLCLVDQRLRFARRSLGRRRARRRRPGRGCRWRSSARTGRGCRSPRASSPWPPPRRPCRGCRDAPPLVRRPAAPRPARPPQRPRRHLVCLVGSLGRGCPATGTVLPRASAARSRPSAAAAGDGEGRAAGERGAGATARGPRGRRAGARSRR